jgi:diguanylate cyclase (GGDEF)-like protein
MARGVAIQATLDGHPDLLLSSDLSTAPKPRRASVGVVPNSPIPSSIHLREERVQALIHDMSGSLTLLMNAMELYRLPKNRQSPRELLVRLQEAGRQIHRDVQSLETYLSAGRTWCSSAEEIPSSSSAAVLWLPERGQEERVGAILTGELGPRGRVHVVRDLSGAMEQVQCHPYDLIVVGYHVEGGCGLQLVRAVHERAMCVPCVVITDNGRESIVAECLEARCMGYLSEGMIREPDRLSRTFHRALVEGARWRQWESSLREMGEMAVTDSLTTVYNRHFIEHLLEMEIKRSERYGHPFCAALLDLDGFKAVNDRHGHHVGDRVLREMTDLLRRLVRSTDHIGRFGGDEFLIVLPQANPINGLRLCKRMIGRVSTHPFGGAHEELGVTLSVGLAHWKGGRGVTVARILEAADAALYEAKKSGKDRVCLQEV